MTEDHARLEQEVLEVVRRWLADADFTAPRIFHRIELEGEYPDTVMVIEHSSSLDPTRKTTRYAIWAPDFVGEDPESIGVLIMTYALGG